MYVFIQNGSVAAYPYSVGKFIADNPNVSIPAFPTEQQLNEVGLYFVASTQKPEVAIDQVVEEVVPSLIDGTWTQQWNVRTATPDEIAQNKQVIMDDIILQTQERLDSFARQRGYDDIKSASGYAGCSIPKFNAEGTYCRDARAETWDTLYSILKDVQSGVRDTPTKFSDVESELPQLVWPN